MSEGSIPSSSAFKEGRFLYDNITTINQDFWIIISDDVFALGTTKVISLRNAILIH